jgi:signal peptidase I
VDVKLNFEKRWRLVRETIETLILTGIMLFVTQSAVQNFHVDGKSMEPGLHDQELILVDKWSYLLHVPVRGDIVVFQAPPDPSQDYVKRIIALPGDIVTIRGSRVTVNGAELREFYVDTLRQGNPYPSFINRVVPRNTYFVLGDNRNGSSDSRDWGCVPRENIIGRAALVYWPLGEDNNGLPPSATSVFQSIPPVSPTVKPWTRCPVAQPESSSRALPPFHHSSRAVLFLALSAIWLDRKRGQFARASRPEEA